MIKNVIIHFEWDKILKLRLAFAFHLSAIKVSLERFIIGKCVFVVIHNLVKFYGMDPFFS